jgi:hypothetical protein
MDTNTFAISYPSLWQKVLDTSRCKILVIDMPPYRRETKAGKANPHKKK